MINRVTIKNWPLVVLFFGIGCIGFAAIFTRLADCNVIASAFWRSALALPIYFFLALFFSKRTDLAKTSIKSMIQLTLVGMIFGIDIAIWNASLNHTSMANAGFLSNTTPIYITLAAWFFSWHPLNFSIWLALGLTLLGAALMTLGSTMPELNWFGDSLAILSAILFALYFVFIAHFRHKINLWMILFFCDLGACLILGCCSLMLGESLAIPNINTLYWLIALSFISQILGQGLVTMALKYFSASFSGLALTLTPLVCVTAAWFIFEEPLTLVQGIGMIFIIIGIYFSKQQYDRLASNAAIGPTGGMIKFETKSIANK